MKLFNAPWSKPPECLRDRFALERARLGRWLRDRGLPLRPTVRLVYHPSYLDFLLESGGRHSFDVRRPARILETLSGLGLLARKQVLTPSRITRDALSTVHPAFYLDALCEAGHLAELFRLDRRTLSGDDGTCQRALEPFLWQTGGTLLAAEEALRRRGPGINLGGGFHHAQRDLAEGFCPVNDLAVAVNVLRRRGAIRRALIIDLDHHQGGGTASIFGEDEDIFTFSIHGQTWFEAPPKEHHVDVQLPPHVSDDVYLQIVRDRLREALDRFHPDLAIYVAGADPARGDRFGDSGISEDALLRRDMHVARAFVDHGIPLAVVLGGGYGPLSWSIPFNFIFALLTGRPSPASLRPSNVSARYFQVHQSLTARDLSQDDGSPTDDELWADLDGSGIVGGLLLGYYTREGIDLALERYGFFDLLREKGFDDLLISIDTRQAARHVMRIHYRDRDPEHLLIEAAACLRPFYLPGGEVCQTLRVEWLLMQNPTANFNLEQPPLPGQDYPGLGLFRWFGEILRLVAMRLSCDGVSNQPERYHNGHLYGKVMRFFRPEDEGVLRALDRDLLASTSLSDGDGDGGDGDGGLGLNLAEATRAVDAGKIYDVDRGEIFRWEERTQVLPITLKLSRYFADAEYQERVDAEMQRRHFRWAEESERKKGS